MKLLGNTEDPEREPLLPQHNGHVSNAHSDAAPPVITAHQKTLDERLHTYLMLRALARGYLPSTDQLVEMLRRLLASGLLARDNRHLTTDGKKLVNLVRKLTSQVIDLVETKNGRDELQDLLSELKRSRVQVDVEGLGEAVSSVGSTATHARAAYGSLSTIGSLLMENREFSRLFTDATVVLREVVGATASTAADYADKAASQIDPSGDAPDNENLLEELGETAAEGAQKTKEEAKTAFDETMTPEKEKQLKGRVREAVRSLRKNADYQSSVSTVSILLKQYMLAYSTAVQDVVDEVTADVQPNKALNKAGELLWSFISSFGDQREWDKLRRKVENLVQHKEKDPDFEKTISAVMDSLYSLMTDPDYLFGDNDKEFPKVEVNGPEGFKEDLDQVVQQLGQTWKSVWNDKQVLELASTCRSIVTLIFQEGFNRELISDVFHVLLPLALQFVQFIPIPRITLTSESLDLLLEPLILEPGKTVNSTSFLPYNLRITTTNEMNLFKGPLRVSTAAASSARVEIRGLTVKADGVGYVMNFRKFFFSWTDSGVASFALDERGLDIGLDLDFTRSLADHMVVLKGVRVKLHKLDFTLKRSKFSFFAWIMRPFVRPLLRKLLETSIRDAIEAGLRAANREMVHTRERLRATRIADPKDLATFVKAVLARWKSPIDEQVDFNIGWQSKQEDVFHGVYAPGSLVGLLETEGADAGERVEEGDQGRWRNQCFDV